MPLQYAQVATLALQNAKVPAFTSQCNLLFQAILEELNFNYNLDICRGTFSFNFNPSIQSPNYQPGSGPYSLPADFLRCERGDFFWYLLGVPYEMVPIDLSEFDRLVQTAAISAYPSMFATDLSIEDQSVAGQANLYVYPPPAGNYPATLHYKRLMPTSTSASTDTSIPWFPNSAYLIQRLTAELCDLAGDDRAAALRGQAVATLTKYLGLSDDKQNRAQRITLDRRRFGGQWDRLPITKQIGW